MADLPYIDHRIEHVGVSKLRILNAGTLRDLRNVIVLHGKDDERLAVLMTYEHYITIQQILVECGGLVPPGS